jgi:hypothetical protein
MSGSVVVDYLAFMGANPGFKTSLENRPPSIGDDHQQPVGELSVKPTWEISTETGLLDQKDLWSNPPKDCTPTEAQALLCPAFCYGYNLDQKKWGFFDVERLTVKRKENRPTNAMEELQLNSKYKAILQPLIREHHNSISSSTYTGSRKGEGLIFLLHGPPGCGKTLTAGKTSISL